MVLQIFVTLFLEVFVEAAGLKISSVPQIYPQKSHVVVDAQRDLVLGCRGAEPLRWTFEDDVNGDFNFSHENIKCMQNTNEIEYKFETILTIYNVSHINVGFYYCHGRDPDFNTPRRSSRIYVFVHDDNILSLITSEEYSVYGYFWFTSIPCRPTSPDINITLKCNDRFSMSLTVTPSNYSEIQKEKGYNVRFDPYNGFTVRNAYGHNDSITSFNCSCYFEREETSFSLNIELVVVPGFLKGQPYIDGLDTVNVGDNITLQCSALHDLYFPYYEDGIQWIVPLSGNYAVENHYALKLKDMNLLISTLKIYNVSSEDEGHYSCIAPKYPGYANKYVVVHDKLNTRSPPRIYTSGPDQEEIQVNSRDNITLRCEGSRPVTWTSNKKYLPFNNTHITYLEKNGLYYSFLQIAPVYYINTDFYYCHEDFIKDLVKHRSRSRHIYIFVKDEQNLHLPRHEWYDGSYAYANVTVPCRPTSRDVNVSLSKTYEIYNRSTKRLEPTPINLTIYEYDPRFGYTIQMPPWAGELTVTCTFSTDTVNSTLKFIYYKGGNFNSEPHIQGPHDDFVFVGDTLQLSCTQVVTHNIPDGALWWRVPNNSSLNNITTESINLKDGKVLISKLLIHNVKNKDEGRYFCYLPYNNATASKFISVYATFEVKPYIVNLTYHYAYVGQPLVLRCEVNVSHNVEFNMIWTAQNATGKHIRIMAIEYTLDVRHRKGQIILEIDNVTDGNEGKYSCYVSNLRNERAKVTKYVQVKSGEAPTMRIASTKVDNPEEIDVLINETARLTCSAEGDPKPTITWMKGSTSVQNLGQRFGFSAHNTELTILLVQKFDAGLYTCIARNPYGEVSRDIYLRVKSESLSEAMIAVIICMAITVIAVAIAFAKFELKKKRRRRALLEDGFNNFKFSEAEQPALSDYDTKWEIPRNKVKLGRNLGSGYFGLVVEATVSNYFDEEPVKTVAVKMLHQNCNNITALYSLLSELKILAHIGKHDNLINLLGACTGNIADRSLLVIIEYCKHGSLRSYLLENRCNFVNLIDPDTELITDIEDTRAGDSGPVTTLDLMHWALQVARGMEFLAARKVVHGDLAARNVLLAENYVVKISDFGLSRNMRSSDYYRKRSQCPLPISWMALESIRNKTFSTWSDVWSFGVVLWELFSLARIPYADQEPDFRFYRKLESGYRLDQPQYSTREIYQVMLECWCAQPNRRPTFSCLVQTLDDLLQDVHTRFIHSQHHYVNLSGECSTAASNHCNDNTTAQDWIALGSMS